MSRKLLLFDLITHVVLEKKNDCPPCLIKCSNECKNSTTTRDDVSYTIFPPPPPPFGSSKKSHMPTILILMLCILGAAFIFLCHLIIRRRRYSSNLSSTRRNNVTEDVTEEFMDENHGPMVIHPIWYINTVGLQQSVIDSIVVFKYKKSDGLIEGSDCSVCLSEFQDDENLRLLPKCSHAFHIDCIDTWLRSHKNCPLCRAPIVREIVQESGESVLNNSGSLEVGSSSADDNQLERNVVIDYGTNRTRSEVEDIGDSRNEDKILEMLERNTNSIPGNNRIRVLSDLVDRCVRLDEELEPVRRSISMDAASASTIFYSVAKIHEEMGMNKQDSMKESKPRGDTKTTMINKPRKSFSFGRSLQKMPIRMKRSFSSSSKILPA